MSVPTFVNLQRFLVGMKFVVKEVAVLRKGCVLTHHIFNYPMPWNLLTKSDKSCATWLIRNHHGLRWEDGNVPYSMVKRLITSAVLGIEEDKKEDKEDDNDEMPTFVLVAIVCTDGQLLRAWRAEMFSFEGCNSSSSSSNNGAKRMNTMNYYVPIHDVETQTYEKKCNRLISFILYSISLDRRAVRILSRRYALTATEYKFLEIGINVGPPSYVEIAVGDPRRGKELLLSFETWKALYEQRQNIQNFFRNDFKHIHSFINVGLLTVRVCTVNNIKLIRLESANVCLRMTESTMHRMFDLDRCINARFDRLIRILATVDAKFAQFSDIASTVKDPKEASNVIYASDAFNTNQIVDCELAALVF
ncbi:uncharacterized protein LOC143895348 [Temnothorax americanus]|uniref:uncharacterized protein LOC143895348 n=1 Tax=Temnothorax americanus TaxID=1964332 RepID=UPI004067E392